MLVGLVSILNKSVVVGISNSFSSSSKYCCFSTTIFSIGINDKSFHDCVFDVSSGTKALPSRGFLSK